MSPCVTTPPPFPNPRILHYVGYGLGMCYFRHFGHKGGMGFSSSGLELGMFLRRSYLFIIIDETINRIPS